MTTSAVDADKLAALLREELRILRESNEHLREQYRKAEADRDKALKRATEAARERLYLERQLADMRRLRATKATVTAEQLRTAQATVRYLKRRLLRYEPVWLHPTSDARRNRPE